MVKTVSKLPKTTPEQYDGAEKLAKKLVEFLDHELTKKSPVKDFTLWTIRNATLDCMKSVIKCELMQMLAEVGHELDTQAEYYRAGRSLEL